MIFDGIVYIYFLESKNRCKKMLGIEYLNEIESIYNVSYDMLYNKIPLENSCQKLVVTFLYGSPIIFDYICFLKQHNIKSCLLIDGPLEYSNNNKNDFYSNSRFKLLSFLPFDLIGCVDENQKEYFLNKGYSAFVYKNKFINKIKIPCNNKVILNKVLITTAKKPYFNDKERNSVCDLIIDIHKRFDNYGLIVEFRIFDNYIKHKCKDVLGEKFVNNVSISLIEQIERNDIIVTTPSSIFFDASSQNKKVVTLDYRYSPILHKVSWRYNKSVNFELLFESLKNDELLDYQINSKFDSKVSFNENLYPYNDYYNFASLRYSYRYFYSLEKFYRYIIELVFYKIGLKSSWLIKFRNNLTKKVKF